MPLPGNDTEMWPLTWAEDPERQFIFQKMVVRAGKSWKKVCPNQIWGKLDWLFLLKNQILFMQPLSWTDEQAECTNQQTVALHGKNNPMPFPELPVHIITRSCMPVRTNSIKSIW